MGGVRQKYNFYAVTQGREIGIYTSWTQAGDAVLGFANAKFKGFITYTDARSAMETAGYVHYKIFDGQNTYDKNDYERGISDNERAVPQNKTNAMNSNQTEISSCSGCTDSDVLTVFIDGSCSGNGSMSAKGGYGVFWGLNHPWNGSFAMPSDEVATNNKAELQAAIKAVEIACENGVNRLMINSDSKYVVMGLHSGY